MTSRPPLALGPAPELLTSLRESHGFKPSRPLELIDLPMTWPELLALPGVGPKTAETIAEALSAYVNREAVGPWLEAFNATARPDEHQSALEGLDELSVLLALSEE